MRFGFLILMVIVPVGAASTPYYLEAGGRPLVAGGSAYDGQNNTAAMCDVWKRILSFKGEESASSDRGFAPCGRP